MADPARQSALELSAFQEQVLVTPQGWDLFLGGGRGGAKSYTLALIALRHAEQYGSRARILYIRKSYPAVADFALLTRELFGQVYGTAARYNGADHVWRLPGGGYFELGQLEGPGDYSKYQGRSFTLLLIDEAGEWPTPVDLDRLRSNLRGGRDVPIRTCMAANPGGPGHAWLSRRYVFRAAPWHPFHEEQSARLWIYVPSTYKDNPYIDQAQYEAQLRASCPTDPELLRAWLEGDWAIARGAYFGSVLSESRNAIDPWDGLPESGLPGWQEKIIGTPPGWRYYLAHDYGSSAPSVTYIVAKSPGAEVGGRWYPRDSLVLIDELATNNPGSPNEGMQYTVPHLADQILEMCSRWGVQPAGVADDAIFSNHGSGAGTIADEFRRSGVYFSPSRNKDRLGGWQMLRRLMQDAGKPDVPGLYVSRRCAYFWETVPYLGRDPRRPEDLDTRGPDHAADAVRYGCVWEQPRMMLRKLKGH